ncbi:MAG: CBS domain-containing protein [Pirellulales bacterium]
MANLRIASDLMATKLVSLSPRTDVFQGISFLLQHNISGAPVVDLDRNYLGVFSEKSCMNVLNVTAKRASQSAIPKNSSQSHVTRAQDIMTTRLITLTQEMDAFDAIGYLLKHRISGAPVIEKDGTFLGVFSEKTSMRVLIGSAYDQLPSSRVAAFMDADTQRVITGDLTLLQVSQIFLDTPYRRLPVLHQGKLLGQISRRDVLRGQHHLAQYLNTEDRDHAILESGIHLGRDELNQETLPFSADVATFMDGSAHTIEENADILKIAHQFLNTPYRRLPVLHEGKLVGQVSRRDVLQATHDSMELLPPPEKSLLYLSSLVERDNIPFS